MNFKSFILGTAASLMTVAGAQAADLPAEPVDYVRVCDAYGSGFYYLPGTDTCLRVGGRVRADYAYFYSDDATGGPGANGEGDTRFQTRAYYRLDARTQTDYGLLRTFINVFAEFRNSSSDRRVVADQAFVQWGGITAGRAITFFHSTWGGGYDLGAFAEAPDTFLRVGVLAYTHDLGNGVSATISLEDTGLAGGEADTNDGGTPDIVGAIRVKQGWGKADLAFVAEYTNGASTAGTVTDSNGNTIAGRTVYTPDDDEYNWGVQGGIELKVPVAGANDKLGVQVAYFDGATRRNPADEYFPFGTINFNSETETLHVVAAFQHFFAPDVSFALTGSYSDVDNETAGLNDAEAYALVGTLGWTPVSGLYVGGEVVYNHIDEDNVGDFDGWSGLFRVQRSF